MIQTILGSGGVIGTELAKVLPKYGKNIQLVSRNPKHVLGDEKLISADLLNAKAVDDAVKGSNIVYLTVGLKYNSKVWEEQWPVVMQNVINACVKEKAKLVFFDNVYMYGKVKGKMTEETPYNPCSKKGEIRAKVASMLQDAINRGDIEAIIARSADFYGEGARHSFAIPMIFDKYKVGKTASWILDKEQPHSMTYTKDAAKGLALLGNSEDSYNQVWHLPTDQNALTGEVFMNYVADAYGVKAKQSVLSSWMLTFAGWFVPMVKETKEMAYQFDSPYLFNSSKFENKFFKPTSYKEGIKEVVSS